MRRATWIGIVLMGCGGASSRLPPTVAPAAEAPLTAAEVEGLAISATSIGPDGRATPYGASSAAAPPLGARTGDPTYGYTPENPIRVGGGGEEAQMAYLGALWGPEGQLVYYGRIGSCCPLPDFGLLDAFALTWEGLETPIVLYIDLYHSGPTYVPVGLTSPGVE